MTKVLDITIFRQDWKRRAACRDLYDLFFSDCDDDIEEAKTICAKCPVRKKCYDYAKHYKPQAGIWAGFTTTELNKLK